MHRFSCSTSIPICSSCHGTLQRAMRSRLAAPVVGAFACVAFATPLVTPLAAQNATRDATTDALSRTERSLVRAVDQQEGQGFALLERVVNINSGTLNFAGVKAVGAVFRAQLDSLGFKTSWLDGASFKRAGHLVAMHPGKGPRILLIGHLDTVFEPDHPFQKFERLDDSHARGPGIIDMKGGDVIIIQTLKALASVGALKDLNVTVVMTGDEERSGEPLTAARAALVDAAKGADYAIGFEDGDGDPGHAVVARRGSSQWELVVKGIPAHSSQIFQPEVGAGAIYEVSRILTEFYRRLSTEPNLTFNPGLVLGGTAVQYDAPNAKGTAAGKDNVVAEHAAASGDLRALTPEQYANAKRVMQEIAAASLPQTSATLTFDDGYPPLAPTDANRALLAQYAKASRDAGLGDVSAVDPRRAGAADVSFVATEAKAIIDGVGMRGKDGHTANETADLSRFTAQIKRMALLLSRLQKSQPPAAAIQ